MPVAIVGGRSSGKSVFVTLLVNTAIRYGTRMHHHFRLYMDPLTNRVVGEMLRSLKKGAWPPATIKHTVLEYEFSFGYTNAFQRFLINLSKGISEVLPTKISKGEFFDVVTFKLIDIAGEDVELLSMYLKEAKQRGVSVKEVLPDTIKYALSSDVIVFLIDGSKVTTNRSDPRWDEMTQLDILMAQLYSFLADFRSMMNIQRQLFPVFVITKFDSIDPQILAALGVGDNRTEWLKRIGGDRELRWKFFEKFMSSFFRQSLSQIYGVVLRSKIELEDAPLFISYVETELNEDGVPVPKVVKRGLENVIVYSEIEYEAFINYFGKIAGKISDKKVSEDQPYATELSSEGSAGIS